MKTQKTLNLKKDNKVLKMKVVNQPAQSLFLVFLASLLLSLSVFAAEAPKPATYGEYSESNEDLSVKIRGGYIKIVRSRSNRQWHINKHWNAMEYVYRNNRLYGISRNGYVYKFDNVSSYIDRSDPNKRITVKLGGGYRWTNRSTGSFIDYDQDLRMVSYGDKNNNLVTLSYDVDGRINIISGPGNVEEVWFEYSLDGLDNQIVLVRDGLLSDLTTRKIIYTYNPVGQLTTFTDTRGFDWTYTYTDTASLYARLATKVDPAGNVTRIVYDGATVSSITDRSGRTTAYRYEYDKNRGVYYKQVKTPGGRVTETWLNSDGVLTKKNVNNVKEIGVIIDKTNSVRVETDALERKTIRHYDQWDNVIKVIHPNGSVELTNFSARGNLVNSRVSKLGVETAYEYDASGNLTKVTEAVGKPEQRITGFTYYVNGSLYTATRKTDVNTVAATITFTYDVKGNLATIEDAENQTIFSAVAYNKTGQLLEWKDGRILQAGNALSWKQTFDHQGRPLTQTNPLGEQVRFEYDNRGNLIKQTAPDNVFVELSYDQEGRPTHLIDPLLAVTRIKYNPAGLIKKLIDAENKTVQSFNYDLWERPISMADGVGNALEPEYGGESRLPDQLAALVTPLFRTEYQYDIQGRPHTVTANPGGADARVNQAAYDPLGNLIESTDPNGKVTRHTYDALNRLIESQDMTTGDTVKYSYDNRDNLLSVINDNNVTIRTYSYNKNSQMVTETWAGGEAFFYTYDINGNVAIKGDAKGLITRYSYDDANRLATVGYYPNLIDPATKTVNYNYDSKGRFTGYSDGVTSSLITYDNADRKLTETVNYGTFSKTFSYSYYKNGMKKTFTGPAPDGAGGNPGEVVTYQYDAANRWLSTDLPGAVAVTVNSYNWVLPNAITLPGGATQSYEYDAFGQQTRIISRDQSTNIIMDLGYTYDKVSNILSRTSPEGTTGYAYDDRYRLTGVDAPGTDNDETYTYDPAGNRLTARNVSGNWQYNNNNQLMAYGDKTLAYDENGNTINETQTSTSALLKSYVYNQEDRLTGIKDGVGASIASYDYDPLGRRLKKTTGEITTYYLYADEGLVAEFDVSGDQQQAYGYVPGSPWGTNPLYTKIGTDYAFYHTDHLGTPQMLTSISGAKVWEGSADAFGQVTVTTETITNNLRFPGQYYDQESGQHYNYFRYYSPVTGRYGKSDPIGLNGGLDIYAYVGGNPLRYTDPFGLFIPQAAGGLIGGGVSAWIYYEDYKCGRISLAEYLAAIALGAGAGAISAGASVFVGAGIAGGASAAQQAVTTGDVKEGEVALAMITAGVGGKIGGAIGKAAFPSKFITSSEKRWYTLWLYNHKVVTETYNELGREAVDAVVGGATGGALSTVPETLTGNDSGDIVCGC